MRLTTFTDYTLRTLIYVALRPGTLTTIADIAEAYNISSNHLMKVVHQLGQAGDVITLRGQHGGVRLARPPSEIIIGEVVRRTEPDLQIVPCFADGCNCAIRTDCKLGNALTSALDAFLGVLDNCTLADLISGDSGLTHVLGIEAPAPVPLPVPA